jgi:hypothetical protein
LDLIRVYFVGKTRENNSETKTDSVGDREKEDSEETAGNAEHSFGNH